jgi:hypothetical protein
MHHDIEIELDGEDAVPPNPLPSMNVGDSVHYFSKAGKVRIVFPGLSPFRMDNTTNTEVTDAEVPTVNQKGQFNCRCFIEIGWKKDSARSGGVHNVGGGS